ncbi:hypothetical protein RF11_04483 [Thelohanellus kitauei]|uniref:Uncharacterized protein n=1 Tax=Thelohanellus kitauei TaxID=669202 RepID=A0A0C2JRF8_THEKT|nr:hypothetical protein RF11_04483 [Thelohanellus kitauei]
MFVFKSVCSCMLLYYFTNFKVRSHEENQIIEEGKNTIILTKITSQKFVLIIKSMSVNGEFIQLNIVYLPGFEISNLMVCNSIGIDSEKFDFLPAETIFCRYYHNIPMEYDTFR